MKILIKPIAFLLILFFGISTFSFAQITEVKNLSNLITVSKSGGDFTDLADAVRSVHNAGKNNRYLILIGPGSYRIQEHIIMKEWVNISGSGEGVTKLIGVTGQDRKSLFIGASNTVISDLEINMGVNSTNRSRSVLTYNGSDVMSLENVKIIMTSSSGNYPIAIASESFLNLKNVDISVFRSKGLPTIGLDLLHGIANIRDSKIKATTTIKAQLSSVEVNNSHLIGKIQTANDFPTSDSIRFYNSIVQKYPGDGELVVDFVENVLPEQEHAVVLFTRTTFLTRFGSPEFKGTRVSCLFSDNGKGEILDSNCLH